MKSQKTIFLLLAMLMMALSAIALSATTPNDNEPFLNNDKPKTDEDFPETGKQGQTATLTPLRGMSRFLASRGNQMTCNKYPKVCRAKDSPGPNCCKKKCVDMSSDEVNCGKCGKKCKYAEICCKGKCVKPMNDERNCGSCNNKCGKGNKCLYGMCSYA